MSVNAHDHSHHGHPRTRDDFGRAFAIGVALNIGFVAVETAFGLIANSMALVADAGHNLSDVLGLLLAWGAVTLGKRLPSSRFTYGLGSSSILAALLNALLLLVAVGAIAWEAILRLQAPAAVESATVMAVAAIGIVVNTATALMFVKGKAHDVNVRGAFLHMAADAAVSAGVVAAGWILSLTGWLWIDPIVSLAIAGVIVWSTWGLLRESIDLALHAVPRNIDVDAVRTYLRSLSGVTRLHDLHIWPMSTTTTALTCHLVMPGGHPGDAFLQSAAHALDHEHGIAHATLQIEIGDGAACPLEPDEVV